MLKLQYKFIIAAVISAVLISAVVFENNKGSAIKLKQIETMKKITVIMQRHMQGDMMHEGIRGDVLGALYFASKDDIKGVESFKNDIDRHYKEFIENLDENLNAGLPNDVSSSVSETKRLVDLYGNKGKEIINRLISNTYYPDLYNEFNDLFEQLETLQEDTSGKIESWASNEKALVEKESGNLNNFILIISAISMFVAIFIAFYGRIAVFKPLSKVTNIMNELAGGSLNVDVPYLSRSDEIGNISKATQVFKENALAKARMEQEQAALKLKMEEDKKKMMRQLADKFEQRVRGIIEAVAAASTELYHTSESMTSVISNANGKAGNVALASKEASGNVNSIASATEEMSASVREIVTQITKSSGVVKQAVLEVQKASETSNMLEKAANQIGEIVEMINNVAEQINLLALNATIESARAGEAGRGFAVVASEVKNLAGETTKSTEEISKHISSIQGISKQVIHTLKSIQDIVINVDEYSSAISAAAEEQNATTKEIAKNMGVIASSSSTINNDVEGVRVSIDEARTSSEQVLDAAKMLSQEAEKLNSEVSIFLKEIAA